MPRVRNRWCVETWTARSIGTALADREEPAGDGLDDVLGLRIRLAHGAVQRHYGANFADLGLTQKQISVLWLVVDNPGIAQADLARRLQMDRATTMALVHALERQGLIARTRCPNDARRVGLHPTDQGRRRLVVAREAIAAHEAWLGDRFTSAERAMLAALLGRVYDDTPPAKRTR